LYKVVLIFLIIVFLGTACSVSRRGEFSVDLSAGIIEKEAAISNIADNNISKGGLFIKKAEVEIISGENRENIIATLKCSQKGEYLISIKSKTGIEAARAFIGRDTLLINDRINKILYYGNSDYIEKKFSLTKDLLPVVFGDFIPGNRKGETDTVCLNGKLVHLSVIDKLYVSYDIDCSRRKIVNTIIETGKRNEFIKLRYSDFKTIGLAGYPTVIDISGLPDQLSIHIEIKSLELPWKGELDFIPGSNYESVEIK